MNHWSEHIPVILDFPKQGIRFRDIAALLANPEKTEECISEWIEFFNKNKIHFDKIAVVDSRGFLFGSMLAQKLKKGLILIRKKGKLPPETIAESYQKEYGPDTLEIRKDTLKHGEKVIIVDDFIVTGGTLKASVRLLKKAGAHVVGVSCIAKLEDIFNDTHIEDVAVYTLMNL